MSASEGNATTEWRQYPLLPIAAALGYATSVIHIYGLAPYIEPISTAFNWSRTQTTFGLTIATLVQALCSIPIGIMVDRVGPRLLGLVGIVLTCGAFAFLGTATGDKTNWYLLWGVMALATLPVQATIWTSAVATRFEASRGMAFAVTLCGASVAQALFPYLGARLIASYGWASALAMQSAIWVAIAFPILFFFFRGARDGQVKRSETERAAEKAQTAGVSLNEGLKSSVYHRLFLTSLLFTFSILGLVVHFVAILSGSGLGKLEAAGLASFIGLFSIAGRLGTGYLLDHFQASRIGALVFILPALACLVLLFGGANGTTAAIAAALIGLTLGSEVDVIVYLTTKHFGLKNFGGLYGGLLMALSVGTATGPLAASAVFDSHKGYSPFLAGVIVLMALSSLLLLSLPRPAFDGKAAA